MDLFLKYFKLERREHFGFDELLFYNPWLCKNCTMSNTDISNFISAGVTKVGNLLDLSKREWFSVGRCLLRRLEVDQRE